jgi:HEAT repeat protein
MKQSVRVFVALALVTAFFVSAAYFRRAPDPAFEGRLASEWAHDLLSSDYTVRGEAESALKILGEPAVPQLCYLLQRRNGPWEEPLLRLNSVLPFLIYRRMESNLARARAAEMLAILGPKAHAAVPALVASLVHTRTGPDCERALMRIGSASVPAIEGALKSRNGSVRESAARLLRESDFRRRATVAALIPVTRDPVAAVRKEAALSMGAAISKIERPVGESAIIVSALLRLTADSDVAVRVAALRSCAQVESDRGTVINALRGALEDPVASVRLEAAKSLWTLRDDTSALIPVLTKILATDERWRAAYALGDMGEKAAPAIPALTRLLAEERVPRPFRTPPSAAFALGKIGRAAIPEIVRLLASPEARVRMNALMAFGFMGKSGREAVPALMKHLEDENAEVRHTTALTLAAIGAEPESIIAGLSACLAAEDIYMRSAAAAALREIAPSENWVVQAE